VFRYGEFNRLMGEAHHFANPGGESCEFGVVVGNKWCKSAIAGLLMGALIRSARTHGLKRMESTVLRTKGAKLRFAHASGFAVCYSDEDPTTVSIVKIL
jgi:acetyltransferase